VGIIFLCSTSAVSDDNISESNVVRDWGVLVYGGLLSEENWKNALNPTDGKTLDSQMVGVAVSYTWSRAWRDRLSFEVEGSIVKHFGLQEHVEVNLLPLGVRWHWFPWTDYVDTTLGLGGGLSYAAQPPDAERVVSGAAEQFLFHWYAEITVGPPRSGFEAVARLHHRSGGFGSLGTQGDVGSDFVTAGIRYRF
jgi:hypothetical protein